MVDGKNASRARLVGEVGHLRTTVDEGGQTVVAQTNLGFGLGGVVNTGAADGHAETRRESLDRLLLQVIPGKVKLGVVDGHATLGSTGEGSVVDDGDAMVRAVGRVLKVQHGSPVVGKVLGHFTSGAAGASTDIALHGGVEHVAADNVVEMGRGCLSGLDDRVETLRSQGRASEAQTCVGRGRKGQRGSAKRLHRDVCGNVLARRWGAADEREKNAANSSYLKALDPKAAMDCSHGT